MKNPTNIGELARERETNTWAARRSGVDAPSGYEPTMVRKAKIAERHREGGDGLTRREAELAAAKKAFRKPKATSRVGTFDEFASGDVNDIAVRATPHHPPPPPPPTVQCISPFLIICFLTPLVVILAIQRTSNSPPTQVSQKKKRRVGF